MIKRLFDLLPFNVRKHYIRPLIMSMRDRDTYCKQYDAQSFFDQFHSLENTDDDRGTISPDFPNIDAKFHYNAIENGIISYVKEHKIDTSIVLDIGSGTGHWIDFYYTVFNSYTVYGADISEVAVCKLEERFKENEKVKIYHTALLESDKWQDESLRLINAIGVLFHIVSDEKWEETIQWCYDKLLRGGVLIASDLFCPITANVQFEPAQFSTIHEYKGNSDLVCNKRVRSKRYWRRVLKNSGFNDITFKKTKKPSHIHTPENNLVFAIK